MLALGVTGQAAAGDLDAVLARLEKLEADNRKISSENASLKERLHRLEETRHVSERGADSADQMRQVSQAGLKTQSSRRNDNSMVMLPAADSFAQRLDENSKWAGFYGGLNAGYGWGASNTASTSTLPLSDAFGIIVPTGGATYNVTNPAVYGASAAANTGSANINKNGIVGGLQVGYNHLLTKQIVIGLEADIQGASINGSGSFVRASGQSSSGESLTLGARV